jgi:hypothetical protein
MNVLLKASILALLFSSFVFSQEPVPIISARWERAVRQAPKVNVQPVGPVVPVMAETKNFSRNARQQRTDNPMDPNEASIEGRSLALDKAVRESRTPQPDDIAGYLYSIEMRNDTGLPVSVIFWEYRFTEIAQPNNVVRRQFLCGVNLKDGEKKEFSVFSTFGPSDVIDAESLSKTKTKLFNESVQVNRIELNDGRILQRNDWKYQDVKDAVQRVTSTPWGTDRCRAL